MLFNKDRALWLLIFGLTIDGIIFLLLQAAPYASYLSFLLEGSAYFVAMVPGTILALSGFILWAF